MIAKMFMTSFWRYFVFVRYHHFDLEINIANKKPIWPMASTFTRQGIFYLCMYRYNTRAINFIKSRFIYWNYCFNLLTGAFVYYYEAWDIALLWNVWTRKKKIKVCVYTWIDLTEKVIYTRGKCRYFFLSYAMYLIIEHR